MHLEVAVGAVAEEFCAARPEVGEPGDELRGRRGGLLVEVDRGHGVLRSLKTLFPEHSLLASTVPVRAVRRTSEGPWPPAGPLATGGYRPVLIGQGPLELPPGADA